MKQTTFKLTDGPEPKRCLDNVITCGDCGTKQTLHEVDAILAEDDCGFCRKCIAHVSLDTGCVVPLPDSFHACREVDQ